MSARTREISHFVLTMLASMSPSAPVPLSWTFPCESVSLMKRLAIGVPSRSEMPSDTATTQRLYFA